MTGRHTPIAGRDNTRAGDHTASPISPTEVRLRPELAALLPFLSPQALYLDHLRSMERRSQQLIEYGLPPDPPTRRPRTARERSARHRAPPELRCRPRDRRRVIR